MKTKKLLLLLCSSMLLTGCSDVRASSSEKESASETSSSSKTEESSEISSSVSKSEESSEISSSEQSKSEQEKAALEAPTLSLDETTESLSWTAVTNADKYEVYDGERKLASISELTYALSVTDTLEHTYTVIALDSSDSYLPSLSSNAVKFTASVSKLKAPKIADDGTFSEVDSNTSKFSLDIQNGARTFELGKDTTSADPSKYGKVVKYKVKAIASADMSRYQDSDWSEEKTYKADILDSDIKTGSSYSLTNGTLPDWYVADEVKRGNYSEGVGIEYGAAYYQAREISASMAVMNVSVRNFRGEDSKMQVYVNDKLIANRNGDETAAISSDNYLTFSYDLSAYIGRKVWVWFVGLTNSSTCVNAVSFKANVTTADTDKFIGSTYGNDNGAQTAWNAEVIKDSSVYTWASGASVSDQGIKMHENYQGYVATEVTVDASCTSWNIDLRSFGSRNSQFYLYIDGIKAIPTILACEKANDDSLKATIDEDGKVHVNDGWTALAVSLDNHIGDKVSLKAEIVAGGDAMIGGFYFNEGTLTTASANKFVGSCEKNDDNAKNAWTAYKENPTGVYTYYRGSLDIRNEGLEFHVNNKDSLSINSVIVSSEKTVWTIDLRGHNNGATYSLSVNDSVIIPTIGEGDPATLDGSTVIANAGWSVLTYDLSNYVGQKVSLKIEITAGGDSMVGGFYFAA